MCKCRDVLLLDEGKESYNSVWWMFFRKLFKYHLFFDIDFHFTLPWFVFSIKYKDYMHAAKINLNKNTHKKANFYHLQKVSVTLFLCV